MHTATFLSCWPWSLKPHGPHEIINASYHSPLHPLTPYTHRSGYVESGSNGSNNIKGLILLLGSCSRASLYPYAEVMQNRHGWCWQSALYY